MWLSILHSAFASVIVHGSPSVSVLLMGLVCVLWVAIGALVCMTLGSYQSHGTPRLQERALDTTAYQEAAWPKGDELPRQSPCAARRNAMFN
jgi:hypothetical protein